MSRALFSRARARERERGGEKTAGAADTNGRPIRPGASSSSLPVGRLASYCTRHVRGHTHPALDGPVWATGTQPQNQQQRLSRIKREGGTKRETHDTGRNETSVATRQPHTKGRATPRVSAHQVSVPSVVARAAVVRRANGPVARFSPFLGFFFFPFLSDWLKTGLVPGLGRDLSAGARNTQGPHGQHGSRKRPPKNVCKWVKVEAEVEELETGRLTGPAREPLYSCFFFAFSFR